MHKKMQAFLTEKLFPQFRKAAMKPYPILAAVSLLYPFVFFAAQPAPVWKIGNFNESPFEFSSELKGPGTFTVGRSNASHDWPTSQKLGAPSKIVFSLDRPQGVYTLAIGVLIDRPRVPELRIGVNGKEGTFFLHPKLSYSRGDFSYAFDPHESQSLIKIELPASLFKAGENTITIACVNEPPTPDQDNISGISYDALSLDNDAAAKFSQHDISIEVEPTVFYRQTAGGLAEVVDIFVRSNGEHRTGTVQLTVAGHKLSQSLPAQSNFGEQQLSFDVPELSSAASGTIKVDAGVKRSFPVSITPARKWTLFVVPHTHLDVGYTDYQGKVAEIQPRVLTQAAALIKQHPDFRFSMDGSWNLQQLLDTRPKAKRDEILNLIRDGKMAMPAQYCNLLTGYASLETLYRSLYESRKLATEYKLPFEYANITDVPTYSGSYPSILASAGIKYWVAASNNDRAPVFFFEHWNEKSPFWWEGPDGQKVLFWYSRTYLQTQTLFGLPPVLPAVRESLPIFLQAYSKPSYKPDVALIYGTQVENTDLFPSTATFADDWNQRYAYPKLKYSTFSDFFQYIDSHFGNTLPTYKGDGSGYWEDGIGSDAYYAAEDRGNQSRALSAEILSSATHSIDPDLNPPKGLFEDIWRNIVLFSEHTWTSYNSVSQPDHEEAVKQLRVKDDRADRANIEIDDVMNRSLSQLADQIHIPSNTLVVFNSLSWKRDAIVETDLFEHPTIIDLSTHQQVPLQVLSNKQRFLHVRFLAKDLPPVGYKCYSISYGTSGGPAEAQQTPANTVENQFYSLKFDSATGAIASIYDKQLQRELVDSKSPYKFGEYLYVTGGDGDTQMINPFPALPPGQLTVHDSTGGKILSVVHMPWGDAIRTASTNLNTPHIDTEVLLFNDKKQIEIRYHVEKNYTTKKEGVYFAFPVAVDKPSFAYASQMGWIDPAHQVMKGGSLEWFNIQKWMAVHDSSAAVGIVPVDASLASFGDINRGKWPGKFEPKSGTIFSYVMNNYWHTNYRAGQGGSFDFRYVITSSKDLDAGKLTQLGLEAMRRPAVDYVVSQDKVGDPQRPLPPTGASFLDISNPNVALVTWKKAEDGHGMILRAAEIGGRSTTAALHFPRLKIASAHLCSGVEENQSALAVEGDSVKLDFKPFQVLTVRVER
jgi:hypothetical protein